MGQAARPDHEPGDRRPGAPPRSQLERAPGERYAGAAEGEANQGRASRAIPPLAIAAVVALAGAGLVVLLGGVLAMSVGLLVVVGGVAWIVGRAVASAGGLRRTRRRAIAIGLALGSAALGQLGLWVYALAQGGALGLVEYLGETWGLVSPLQLVVAAVVAWWATR